ncbi:MAG: hypothetical protein K2K86_03000, partial [Muribaculaceae bacterium]|nr:hypothetical protein [Muribaculaceae bacterium]
IILNDLVKLMDPRYIEVRGLFTPRGGISIYPFANHGDAEHQWLVNDRLKASFLDSF